MIEPYALGRNESALVAALVRARNRRIVPPATVIMRLRFSVNAAHLIRRNMLMMPPAAEGGMCDGQGDDEMGDDAAHGKSSDRLTIGTIVVIDIPVKQGDGIRGSFFAAAGSRHSPHSARRTTNTRTFVVLRNRDATPTWLDDPEFSPRSKILGQESWSVRPDRDQETHGGLAIATTDRRHCEIFQTGTGLVSKGLSAVVDVPKSFSSLISGRSSHSVKIDSPFAGEWEPKRGRLSCTAGIGASGSTDGRRSDSS